MEGTTQAKNSIADLSAFDVPWFLHLLGGIVHYWPDFWIRLGKLETSLLAQDLTHVPLPPPIFICGLARSGSTILHEMISSHPGVATHRMKDYPMIFTPFWWRQATSKLPRQSPRERSHRDGIMVNLDSPDALEEMLWMAFFPKCHDPRGCNVLGPEGHHPAFESFYQNHLRKLILAEGAQRYAAKANYHITRLGYLVHLFPDARIILPVREPVGHIASLMRQHTHFSRGQRKYPRALAFMRRSGHFEFGLDRRPMNLGDNDRVRQIRQAWAAGEEVLGQALYWDMVHGYLANMLASNERIRSAVLIVPFEQMCADPQRVIRSVFQHCGLLQGESIIRHYVSKIRQPTYYKPSFSSQDLELIRQRTATSASRFGYG